MSPKTALMPTRALSEIFMSTEPSTMVDLRALSKTSINNFLKEKHVIVRRFDSMRKDQFFRGLIDSWDDMVQKLNKASDRWGLEPDAEQEAETNNIINQCKTNAIGRVELQG